MEHLHQFKGLKETRRLAMHDQGGESESRGFRRGDEPHSLGHVLSHLFALRGYGRRQGSEQLTDTWKRIAGESISSRTRVRGIRAGVLQIAVNNSVQLQELESFHKHGLLEKLEQEHADLGITDIKFRLSSRSGRPG